MRPQAPLRDAERENYAFFLNIPDTTRADLPKVDHKTSQFLEPLFEYSGACAGCGETPYIKLLTQLFGDRALVANATGCSSIYGGNLPTTPYTTNRSGRGPAWSNSLFEDNAEFGLGLRLAVDNHAASARARSCSSWRAPIGEGLADAMLPRTSRPRCGIRAQRERVHACVRRWRASSLPEARRLETLVDYLVTKSVWLVGGDGWAYDIGFGGLDHVLASGRNVNILVLDTEVYSNTGGQQSKATPIGAVAKFASAGKTAPKKDLGLLANMYGHVYVARVAFGARMSQTVQAFLEAEAYPGPSLIIAYSHCIAHGYDMAQGAAQQKLAVDSGVWPLFRFDPRRAAEGRAAAASRLRTAEAARGRLHAQRVALPRGRAHRSGALQDVSQRGAEDAQQRYFDLPADGGHQVPQVEASRVRTADAGERASHGSQHEIPRHDASRIRSWSGASPLVRRPRHRQAPRGRRGRRDRPALAVRRADRARADGGVSSTSTATASRSPKPTSYFPSPEPFALGPDAVPRTSAASETGGRHSGHRVAQRIDARRLARVRAADGRRPAPTRSS